MMKSRSFLLRPALAFALLAIARNAGAQAPAPGPPDTVDVVLSVSGGISLGSYESGANWSLVEFLRQTRDSAFQRRHNRIAPHRLAVVTGASAGNINALLSAFHWCAAAGGPARTAEQTLFWEVWTRMGIVQIFPNDSRNRTVPRLSDSMRTAYGIFRREFMEDSLFPAIVGEARPTSRGPCEVSVGVTLTKLAVDSITLNGQINPRTQRFVSLFQVRTREVAAGNLLDVVTAPDTLRNDGALGLLAIPPSDPDGRIELDSVLKIVEASSAFPLAFEPVKLRYHPVRSRACVHQPAASCTQITSALFMDGGVFDNNPLGLGIRMYHDLRGSEPKSPDQARPEERGTRERYVYIDPDGTRTPNAVGSVRAKRQGDGRGLSSISALLGGAVPAARQYELHALARNLTGDARRDRISTTDRSHRLVSSHLGAFAGFLGRPFREYDFYVGMYDGLYFAARDFDCGPERPGPANCVRDALGVLLNDTAFRFSPAARTVLVHLYREEFGDTMMPAVAPRTRSTAVLLAVDAALDSIRRAPECTTGGSVTRALCRDGFMRFVRHLSVEIPAASRALPASLRCDDAADCVDDREMQRLMDDPERYLARLASRVIDRMDNVERGLHRRGNHAGVALAGAIYHMGVGEPRRGWEKDPSSVPDTRGTPWRTLSHALPYYVGFGTTSRMVEAGFRPAYYFGQGTAIVFPLLPVHYTPTGDSTRRQLFAGYGAGFHTGVVGPLDVEATYQQLRPYDHLEGAPVNTVDVGVILGEKLRVGVRTVARDRSHIYGSRKTTMSIGILDLNGLIYWTGRVAHR